jgi:hypothetical protein
MFQVLIQQDVNHFDHFVKYFPVATKFLYQLLVYLSIRFSHRNTFQNLKKHAFLLPGARKRRRRWCKPAKPAVFHPHFTSARNATKIGGQKGGRLVAKKRLVKRADVLRRN